MGSIRNLTGWIFFRQFTCQTGATSRSRAFALCSNDFHSWKGWTFQETWAKCLISSGNHFLGKLSYLRTFPRWWHPPVEVWRQLRIPLGLRLSAGLHQRAQFPESTDSVPTFPAFESSLTTFFWLSSVLWMASKSWRCISRGLGCLLGLSCSVNSLQTPWPLSTSPSSTTSLGTPSHLSETHVHFLPNFTSVCGGRTWQTWQPFSFQKTGVRSLPLPTFWTWRWNVRSMLSSFQRQCSTSSFSSAATYRFSNTKHQSTGLIIKTLSNFSQQTPWPT